MGSHKRPRNAVPAWRLPTCEVLHFLNRGLLVSSPRRLLSVCAVLVASLALVSSAVARPHVRHAHRVSGLVAAINVAQHTLKLRLHHGAKRHAASAGIATASGAGTIVVSFANATVSGPNGAVAVGDHVTVTTNGPVGPSAVASSIQVIGHPNGGDAGKGAAIPGTVTAIDSGGTLTLAVGSRDSQQGEAQDSAVQAGSVTVSVPAATILAVGDTNGDGTITLGDISEGDHVVVFTADATADPIVAVGILDASQPGANSHEGDSSPQGSGGGDGNGAPSYQAFAGTVAALGPPNAITVTVSGDGPLGGQTVTIDVTAATHYKGVPGYGSIAVGDQVRVYSQSLAPLPIVAVFIGDGPGGSDSGSPPPAPAPAPASSPTRFGGTVTDVRGDGLTVTVTSGGPLSGQSVIVAVPAGTAFVGVASLSGVSVGDAVEIFTASTAGSPVRATKVSDEGAAAS